MRAKMHTTAAVTAALRVTAAVAVTFAAARDQTGGQDRLMDEVKRNEKPEKVSD